jgi:dipeptidyl aminopeptidase/acylaminoacyl peptidase
VDNVGNIFNLSSGENMKKLFLAVFVSMIFCAAIMAQNYSIERYLNIRSAGSPTLSNDGKRLAFLTNITGTNQIWMMDSGGGYPEQVTSYADNIGFVRWSPSGSGLVFGKAIGGNENTQFFWMSNDGSEIRELTNNPTVRHNFAGFSHDGAKIYYSSNKRDRTFFDVYSMDAASGREELLFQHDGNNDFAAASKDGSKIIISRDGTELSLDNNLYLVDVKTKQETLLTPHEGSSEFGVVDFLDDNTILLDSNDGREFGNLARMDLRTKKVQFLDDTNWDLGGGEISDDGRMFAYTINRDGFSELYIIETKDVGKKSEPVKLPAQGIVGGLDFSKDNSKIAFTFSGAKYNSDIWTYDLQTKQLMQVTKSSRSGIPQKSFVEPGLIKYKTFDGREIPAWFYSSRKFSVDGVDIPQKVIISVHGGPEGQERPGFNSLYQYYLSRGYAILATNVRGSTGYGKTFTHLDDVQKREDSVKDLAYSVDWLKANGADPKRIAVMGGSYGGYMTMAAITLYPDLFAAAVNTVGIVNWETFLKNTSGYRRRAREVEYGMLDKDIDFLRRISPLAKVDKIKTPLFVIHGKNDPRVPYIEAEQVVEALKKRNATVEYKLFDDEGHGISKLKNRLVLYPLVADFLDKYMK